MTFPEGSKREAVSSVWWGVAATAVLVVLGLTDLELSRSANISGSLVVAPFLSSVGGRPRQVFVVGALALVCGVMLASLDGSGLRASTVRLVVLVAGTLGAAQAARIRLLRQERLVALSTVAKAAQQAILQPPAPTVGPVRVATFYQSAFHAATVGGDCFEILDTPHGVRAIVGDVRGKGMPAIRLAAAILGGFRVLAFLEADLVGIAHQLDLLTARYAADSGDGEEFVTAVMLELGPDKTLRVANCGHHPPLSIGSGGVVNALECSSPTVPFGLGSQPTVDELIFPSGGRVLAYTDGAVEARGPDGRYFDLQQAAAAAVHGSGTDGLDMITRQLARHTGGKLEDDVALMLLELP